MTKKTLNPQIKMQMSLERVKCVDIHPEHPWILVSLLTGEMGVLNYETQQVFNMITIIEKMPVQSAKFIPEKNWIVASADDEIVRVFDSLTLEFIHQFKAHENYISTIFVHPNLPLIITCADDNLIKSWNWEKNWQLQQVFEGHEHCPMQVAVEPNDGNNFASASLDRTLRLWKLNDPSSKIVLQGHEKAVNCLHYFYNFGELRLISGSDDETLKVWDLKNKSCLHTLKGHSNSITAICIPYGANLILSCSTDSTVQLWDLNTFDRGEPEVFHTLHQIWTMACKKNSKDVAIGGKKGGYVFAVAE